MLGDPRAPEITVRDLPPELLAVRTGDSAGTALNLQESAVALGRELQNPRIVATALSRLAHLSLFRTEFERGDEVAAESYEQYRQLADGWGMAFALGTRGLIARSRGQS